MDRIFTHSITHRHPGTFHLGGQSIGVVRECTGTFRGVSGRILGVDGTMGMAMAMRGAGGSRVLTSGGHYAKVCIRLLSFSRMWIEGERDSEVARRSPEYRAVFEN